MFFMIGVLLLFAGCAADVPKNKILNSTQLMENTFWVYYYGFVRLNFYDSEFDLISLSSYMKLEQILVYRLLWTDYPK